MRDLIDRLDEAMKWPEQRVHQMGVKDALIRARNKTEDLRQAMKSLHIMFKKQEGMGKMDDADVARMGREFAQHRAQLERMGAWLESMMEPVNVGKWK